MSHLIDGRACLALTEMLKLPAQCCITGEVAERLGRKWVCAEMVEDYLEGAKGRFKRPSSPPAPARQSKKNDDGYYRIPHPGLLWKGGDERECSPIPEDGGRSRPKKPETKIEVKRLKPKHSTKSEIAKQAAKTGG